MNDKLWNRFLMGAVASGLFVWATASIIESNKARSEAYALEAQQAACVVAELDFKGNSLCYQDPSCMISGTDFRNQLHTAAYLKEYCPNEWEASKGPAQTTGARETNPGKSVWDGTYERWTPTVSSTQ